MGSLESQTFLLLQTTWPPKKKGLCLGLFCWAGKHCLLDTVESALTPCGASVIRTEYDLCAPPLDCCDTLLLSRMPHLRFCQKFPYRAANGSSSFSSPSKTETSLSFFENQLPVLILIVSDAAHHRVGDFQNVVGRLL